MAHRNSTWRTLLIAAAAVSTLQCAGATVRPTTPSTPVPLSSWWTQPDNLPQQDLFHGPWGTAHAPDPAAEYTFLRPKSGGFNPGVIVRDPQGREWHVKQPRSSHGDEGPSELVLSRVLSALGYHQPPVYYLPSFTMRDKSGVHIETGGRFRLDEPSMKDMGEWSWQQNPFVGQRPYQGLLVILLMFNSSDLKNSNNTLYQVTRGGRTVDWYVVRDLGDALGKTGRFAPQRNNLEIFSRTRFITGVDDGFAEFGDYRGLHGELLRRRITPADVAWASALIGGLSDRQWQDAFRAGGYPPNVARRFISILRSRVAEGQRIGTTGVVTSR
jgi:hypothetical protein